MHPCNLQEDAKVYQPARGMYMYSYTFLTLFCAFFAYINFMHNSMWFIGFFWALMALAVTYEVCLPR